jgi:hypothetical protein
VFASDNTILDPYADARKRRVEQPWAIRSIGLREWASRREQRALV